MHLYYLASAVIAAQDLAASSPMSDGSSALEQWLYNSQIDDHAPSLLDRSDISLEPAKGDYDFSNIRDDYEKVLAKGKKFWVQPQDRSFNATVDPQLNPRVRHRYQTLLNALAEEFDGKITSINLPETFISVTKGTNNYTDEGYYLGELENAGNAAQTFKKSYAVQYVNFWPDGCNNTNNRFTDSFNFYAKHGRGCRGARLDSKQTRTRAKLINQNTGNPFTKEELVDFAVNELHVRILFWTLDVYAIYDRNDKNLEG
ncbi:hypothetical protein V8C34DRAFT_319042 [Trichoderma compactum]